MPHHVPVFEWSDDALHLRAFVYEFWCEQGRGPTLAEVHAALGRDRHAILEAYKELQLGLICVIDQDSFNGDLVKFQPFASHPTQVKAIVDGAFHSFAGCAMEAVAFGHMPPFAGRDVRLEGFCACCFEPITFGFREGELIDRRPDTFYVHVNRSPYQWANVDIRSMCDAMNFVIDADHAREWERQTGTAGVLFDLQQAQWFTSDTAKRRMHDHHWPPGQLMPEAVIRIVRKLGVDTTAWGLPPKDA